MILTLFRTCSHRLKSFSPILSQVLLGIQRTNAKKDYPSPYMTQVREEGFSSGFTTKFLLAFADLIPTHGGLTPSALLRVRSLRSDQSLRLISTRKNRYMAAEHSYILTTELSQRKTLLQTGLKAVTSPPILC